MIHMSLVSGIVIFLNTFYKKKEEKKKDEMMFGLK